MHYLRQGWDCPRHPDMILNCLRSGGTLVSSMSAILPILYTWVHVMVWVLLAPGLDMPWNLHVTLGICAYTTPLRTKVGEWVLAPIASKA